MDQRGPLMCLSHNKVVTGMCVDELCKSKDKLYCNVCIRKEHSECDGNKSLAESEFIQELKQLRQDLGLMLQTRIDTDSFLAIKNELLQQLALVEQQIIQDNIRLNQYLVVYQRIECILQNSFTKEVWIEGYNLVFNKQKNQNSSFEEINLNLKKLQQSIDALSITKNTPDSSQSNIQHNVLMVCDWAEIALRETFHFKSVVRSISCSSDRNLIACACDDFIIRGFDPKNGKFVVPDMKGHTTSVNSVCFSKDNKLLVSGSNDKSIRIWDTGTGKQIGDPIMHASYVLCVTISPDSQQIASGCNDNSIILGNVVDRKSKTLVGHIAHVSSVDYSPDGNLLVSGGHDCFIGFWDIYTGKELAYYLKGHTQYINCVRFSANGKNIVSGSADKTARIWDINTGKQLQQFDMKSVVTVVAYSPNSDNIITGSDDFQIILWDLKTDSKKALKPHTNQIHALQYSSDGRYIVSGSQDMTIKVQPIQ